MISLMKPAQITARAATELADLYEAAGTTLAELTEAVERRLPALGQRCLSAEQVGLSAEGRLCFGSRALQLDPAAWATLACYAGLPAGALLSLENEERAFVLNRRVSLGHAPSMPERMRLMIDEKRESIVGIADARLVQASMGDLLRTATETLPRGLCPAEVRVGSFQELESTVCLKLYAPSVQVEPRPGDTVHGGVALIYSVTGNNATQVFGYTRREACRNEAICHVCTEGHKRRTRRQPGNEHQLENLLMQVRRLLSLAWEQTGQKLEALKDLLREKGDPRALLDEFVQANRRALSINKRVIAALHRALAEEDELTGTAFDVWNALSRVATHGAPSLMTARQRMNLYRAAGELAQHTHKQCDACGTWLRTVRGEKTPEEAGAAL